MANGRDSEVKSGDLTGAPETKRTEVEVTPEMIEVGVRVLWNSGAIDHPCSIDRDLIRKIYMRMAIAASR